jgi:F420-non-reducing hydrogenase small subunit
MKPKVAFYWCASCGGCEEAVVDLAEKVLDVTAAVDIVFWPVALDFKRADVEAMPDGSIAAAFINGAVRTSEQEEMAHLLRRKARVVIAFGACAQTGGVPGLSNLYDRESVLAAVYRESPSTANAEGVLPQTHYPVNGETLELPVFQERVRALEQVIPVDYSIPGCPPTPKLLADAVAALLTGRLPERGAVLAPDKALCEECPRRDSKPEKLAIQQFKRPHEALIETDKCLLAQGLLCLGPATRGGCEARCIQGNMPCTGCFGATSRVRDFGAKALSAVASLTGSNDEAEIARILQSIPDPAGTFYRYSLPVAPLPARRAPAAQ